MLIVQLNKDGELHWFKRFGHFSIIFIFLTTVIFAESFEEFKKSERSSFEQYKDEKDAEFNKYLKSQWEEYTSQYSKPLYKDKKPRVITPSVERKIKSVGPEVNIKIKKSADKPRIVSVPEKVIKKDINFLFFGQAVGFDINDKYKRAKFYPQNQSGILNFFNVLASSYYEDTIIDLQNIKKELKLNDWGMYLLVNQLSKNIFSYPDDIKLFSWFMFNKLGYEVKVGLSGKHIVLMYYSKKLIYSTPNYKFNSKSFYVIANYAKGSVGKVYTYRQSYPQAHKALDLALKELPNFKKDIKHKILTFKQFGKKYTIPFEYDKNLIDFMATYPQADYDTYFNSPMSEITYNTIAQYMKKHLDSKKASVAINFVLNFVQNAFVYEVDQTQFKREKVMFADETLFYDKSDCEDRAILFSHLVKKLFGISVIGVKYSDHMATALYIPINGDSVKANNKKFIIADPTYMNANIGQSMPKYKSIIPDSFIIIRG